MRDLDAAGYEIVDLDVSRTSLEEVFVEMTNHEEETRAEPALADGGDE